MNFAIETAPEADLVTELRDAEQNFPKQGAPKHLRELIRRAFQDIEHWRGIAQSCAAELEEASRLRVGEMDSLSKAGEIQRRTKQALSSCAHKLRQSLPQ